MKNWVLKRLNLVLQFHFQFFHSVNLWIPTPHLKRFTHFSCLWKGSNIRWMVSHRISNHDITFDGLSALHNLPLQSFAANWCKPCNSFAKVPEPYTCNYISRVEDNECKSGELRDCVSQSLSPGWTPPWCWPQSAGPPPIPQSLTAGPHSMNSVLFNFHSLPQTSACCIITSRPASLHCCSLECQACESTKPQWEYPSFTLSLSFSRSASPWQWSVLCANGLMLPDKLMTLECGET